MKRYFFFLSLFLSVFLLSAQDFQQVSHLPGLSEEVGVDVVVDTEGNRYLGGFFGNTIDVASGTINSQGFRDGLLVKYNPSGQEVWHHQLGSNFDDEVEDLGMDAQDQLYVLINHNDTLFLQGGQKIFSSSYWSVLTFDSDGNLLNHFNPFVQIPIFFRLADMAVSPSGKITLVGEFGLTTSTNSSQLQIGSTTLSTHPNANGQFLRQAWIASYTPTRQSLWALATRSTGISGATAAEVETNEKGDVLVCGTFSPDPMGILDVDFGPSTDTLDAGEGTSLFVARWDSTGSFEGAEAIRAFRTDPSFPADIRSSILHWAKDGSILLGGSFMGSLPFGGDTLLAPFSMGFPGERVFLARFNSSQQADWAIEISGSQFNPGRISAASSDANGNLYLGGTFLDSLTLNGQLLTGMQDLFLASLDSTGQTNWLLTAQGEDSNGLEAEVNGLHSTNEGVLSLVGSIDAPATFGGITLDEPAGTSCCSNAYLALIADRPLSLEQLSSDSSPWRVFPNPANMVWWLEGMDGAKGSVEIQLFDLVGRVLYQEKLRLQAGQTWAIPAEQLAAGRYWLKVSSEQRVQTIPLQKHQ